jgi:hypothetical protein
MKAQIFAQIIATMMTLLIVSPAQSQQRVAIDHDAHMGEENYTYFESKEKVFDGDLTDTYLTIVSTETDTGDKDKTPLLVKCNNFYPAVISVYDSEGPLKAYQSFLNLSTIPSYAEKWRNSIYLYTCHEVNLDKIYWDENTYETIVHKFGYTKGQLTDLWELNLSDFPVLEQAYRQLKKSY